MSVCECFVTLINQYLHTACNL